jgi:hypothetical protein
MSGLPLPTVFGGEFCIVLLYNLLTLLHKDEALCYCDHPFEEHGLAPQTLPHQGCNTGPEFRMVRYGLLTFYSFFYLNFHQDGSQTNASFNLHSLP